MNWREVKPRNFEGLTALFPCKPDTDERRITLPPLTQPAKVHLLSCQAGGATWALTYLTVPDAGDVTPALRALSAMRLANLNAAAHLLDSVSTPQVKDLRVVNVPGMTANDAARAWRVEAQRPDSRGLPLTMEVRAWHFSHGLTVFQASVSRPLAAPDGRNSEDVADTFVKGLHFPG